MKLRLQSLLCTLEVSPNGCLTSWGCPPPAPRCPGDERPQEEPRAASRSVSSVWIFAFENKPKIHYYFCIITNKAIENTNLWTEMEHKPPKTIRSEGRTLQVIWADSLRIWVSSPLPTKSHTWDSSLIFKCSISLISLARNNLITHSPSRMLHLQECSITAKILSNLYKIVSSVPRRVAGS